MKKEDIERIKYMEKVLNDQDKLINNLNKALDEFKNNQKEYIKLVEYYTSQQYFDDLAKDKNEEIPKNINTGIFTEDLVYNLMTDQFNIGIKMMEIGLDTIKKY